MRSHAAGVSRVLRQMPLTNCRLWTFCAFTRHLPRSTHRPSHCRVCYALDIAAIVAGRSRANNCREEQPGDNPHSWRIPANYCTPDVWQAPPRSLSWSGPVQVREVLCCDAVASQFVPFSVVGLQWCTNQARARNPSPEQTPQSRPRADMSMLRYRCMPGNSIVRCRGRDRIKYPGRCLQSHFFRNRHSGALG